MKKIFQLTKKHKRILLFAALFAIVFTLIGLKDDLVVREYELVSAEIESPLTIVLLADLHNDVYGEGQSILVDMVKAQEPDIIILAGDMVDNHYDIEPLKMLIKQTVKIAPTFYVTGNHEAWTQKSERIKEILANNYVHVLENEMEVVEINSNEIAIYGIDDPDVIYYEELQYESYEALFAEMMAENPYDGFKLLIAHRPEEMPVYQAGGFDLIVSGHTHGGQVRIPFLMNGLIAPNQGVFPKYGGGEYVEGDTTLIVSRGLITNNIPRIYNPPEVVVIQIVPSEE